MKARKLGKLVLLACCVVVLPVIVCNPVDAVEQRSHKHKVRSSELTTSGLCKVRNLFGTGGDVYATGKFFPPNETVWIYVTSDRNWGNGDPISDVSTDGVDSVVIDGKGRIPCPTKISGPLGAGNYDIVVDANCDGTFDVKDGDAVDGKTGRGFRVIP